ncbi:MAG: neutral/alkaline non-lysosomal ceramidase N-terminal domain-containing protein [Planctomycetes bacterium]|nr:neutral/alkaline non-lysosomal ceramidase N-terminal domain-containing protein [Planctomycetota bacterium]MBL7037500.1 neutral/alkaline non-lysosomal ceramidase N-terminal domain-containing protein [Pirellulaceae bacterium]
MKRVDIPQSRCLAGVTRDDITPPVGIYHRMWGAAMHDRSTGVHRPLTATALYLSSRHGERLGKDGKVIVALDHCLFRSEEMNELVDRVSSAASIPRDAIIVFFSHTHAAGLMDRRRSELPGGDLIGPYLDSLATKLAALVREARDSQQPASIVYGVGRCDLARSRDYFDAERGEYVCGYNPEGEADDAVVVGRITDDGGKPLATIVNYACHPTTLAWENTLISPDYIGATREVVEQATGAPCLFVQGASGDVGPRDGFVGDVAVADRNGRQLGYAVMSAVESMPTPGTSYEYTGPVISGATLGIWKYIPVSADRRKDIDIWESRRVVIPLKYRDDLPKRDDLERERKQWSTREAEARAAGDDVRVRDARAMVERMARSLSRIRHLPPGDECPYAFDIIRIGDAVWLGLNGEHYNRLQREIRRRFAQTPIFVGTLANGSGVSYLLDSGSYGKGLYQEKVSVLAKGSLDRLVEAIADEIQRMGIAIRGSMSCGGS